MPEKTVTIRDNRTGKEYEIPIEDGTIRANDLRQIKVSPDDFGLMTYDPGFLARPHAEARLPISMVTRVSSNTGGIPSNSWSRITLTST